MLETSLPKSNEPLNCAFQRRDMGAKIVECSLTEKGQANVLFRVVERDACLIDICPMYQTWQLLKKNDEPDDKYLDHNVSAANLKTCGNCENLFPGTLLECPKCGFSEPSKT